MHFFDTSQLVAIGLLSGAVALAWERRGPKGRAAGVLALCAASIVLGELVLTDDAAPQANRWSAIVPPSVSRHAMVAATSLLVPIAALSGRALAGGWRRVLVFAAMIPFALANGWMFATRYEGIHLVASAMAGVAMAEAMKGAAVPSFAPALSAVGTRVLAGVLVLCSAVSLVAWPGNAVLLQLFNAPSAVLMPFLVKARARQLAASGPVPPELAEWFVDRKSHPPIPPSAPSLLPKNPIVVFFTFDSVRAELFEDDKNAARFPTFTRIKRESVVFAGAHSAGSSTSPSLTSIFTSKYLDQIDWTYEDAGGDSAYYPVRDPSPRFVELLRDAGWQTVNYGVQAWAMNKLGLVRGFSEEALIGVTRHYPRGSALMNPALSRIEQQSDKPAFFYMHFLDAHWPYRTAGARPTPYEGYLAEMEFLDSQLRALLQTFERRRWTDRLVLVLTADHGEAFGEHGLTFHGTSLYEELLHVPLFVRVPGVAPRVVGDRVSLIDLAPTFLDLAGLPTPGEYMGQSLVPYLRGESPKLTRPMFAEGAKGKRALLSPDGTTTIQDTRRGTLEIYDTVKDPGELVNLEDDPSIGRSARLGLIGRFFAAQSYRAPGYVAPFL